MLHTCPSRPGYADSAQVCCGRWLASGRLCRPAEGSLPEQAHTLSRMHIVRIYTVCECTDVRRRMWVQAPARQASTLGNALPSTLAAAGDEVELAPQPLLSPAQSAAYSHLGSRQDERDPGASHTSNSTGVLRKVCHRCLPQASFSYAAAVAKRLMSSGQPSGRHWVRPGHRSPATSWRQPRGGVQRSPDADPAHARPATGASTWQNVFSN